MPITTPVKATQARVERILKRCESALTPGQLAALAEIVEYELRQQDRDTRHACAEAVLAIAQEPTISGSEPIKLVITAFCQRAHTAVMNTQAV